jgi:cytidine deaminase
MTHSESSVWYERSIALRGANDALLRRGNRGASTTRNVDASAWIPWWDLYLCAATAGLSAALSYYALQHYVPSIVAVALNRSSHRPHDGDEDIDEKDHGHGHEEDGHEDSLPLHSSTNTEQLLNASTVATPRRSNAAVKESSLSSRTRTQRNDPYDFMVGRVVANLGAQLVRGIPSWVAWGLAAPAYCASIQSSSTSSHGVWLCLGMAWMIATIPQDQTPRPEAARRNRDCKNGDPDDVDTMRRAILQHDDPTIPVENVSDDVDNDLDILPHPTAHGVPSMVHTTMNSGGSDGVKVKGGGGKPPLARTTAVPPPPKYLELLVHNVSHTDLVLGLDFLDDAATRATNDDEDEANRNYMRPRFSSFDLLCRLVLRQMNDHKDDNLSELPTQTTLAAATAIAADQVYYFPRYQRSMDDPRYAIREWPVLVGTSSHAPPPRTPTGFRLPSLALLPPNITHEDVRIREGHDEATILAALNDPQRGASALGIRRVFFPLLAAILPVWHRHIAEKEYHSPVKRVLILVTGVGTPRNPNHDVNGNSTQVCADLMRLFLARVDPTLVVVTIHSTTNVFRYDENLLFCERELMPTIHAYRDAHATGTLYPDEQQQQQQQHEEQASRSNTATSQWWGHVSHVNFAESDWRNSMHVTLSFADGSPARTHAIQASLRSYRPTYFHFWQLKTFWHESKVVDDDIEVHSFETMETRPAVDADRVRDPGLQLVVQEMRGFYQEMNAALVSGNNDIHRFWLRKTHKPVLAVLLVQSSGEAPRLYRGTNMEVSMPTGSLCAERSAIGSALAANPNLKRHDLKLIAVLAVPPPPPTPPLPVDSVVASETGPVWHPPNASSGTAPTTAAGTLATAATAAMRRVSSYSSIVVEESTPPDHYRPSVNSRKSSFGSEYEPLTDEWVWSSDHVAAPAAPPDHALNSSHCSLATTEEEDAGEMGGGASVASSLVGTTVPAATTTTTTTTTTEPLRRIALFTKTTPLAHNHTGSKAAAAAAAAATGAAAASTKRLRKTVVVHSTKDVNPLSPCGACNEWLKKIAESNPYFSIVTFTDANCSGIYVSPCKE